MLLQHEICCCWKFCGRNTAKISHFWERRVHDRMNENWGIPRRGLEGLERKLHPERLLSQEGLSLSRPPQRSPHLSSVSSSRFLIFTCILHSSLARCFSVDYFHSVVSSRGFRFCGEVGCVVGATRHGQVN